MLLKGNQTEKEREGQSGQRRMTVRKARTRKGSAVTDPITPLPLSPQYRKPNLFILANQLTTF